MSASHSLSGVLFAPSAHPLLEEKLSTAFSKLIGSWSLVMKRYAASDHSSEPMVLEGEWHFGWFLNGLAVQDVWVVPIRSPSSIGTFPYTALAGEFLEYETAVRFFSAQEGVYRSVWAGPLQGKTYLFTAEAQGGTEVELVAGEQVLDVERGVMKIEGKGGCILEEG